MSKHNKDKNKNLLPSIYHTKEVKVTDNKSLTFKETQINVWKKQMIPVAKLQYKTEPNKVINADCVKNARHFMVKTSQSGKPIDFSIMPSFECNLKCWFCMYDCSPTNKQMLDYYKTKIFLSKFDWSQINIFGFYGGEPSINTILYQLFIDLIPSNIPRFIITNGSWSRWRLTDKKKFIIWCIRNKLQIIISSTSEHLKYQDREFLEILAKNLNQESPNFIVLKKPDEIHAQGRAKGVAGVKDDCEFKCQRIDRNIRLGLKPTGEIVFQNCHGEYHVVQTYEDRFNGILDRTVTIRDNCYKEKVNAIRSKR